MDKKVDHLCGKVLTSVDTPLEYGVYFLFHDWGLKP